MAFSARVLAPMMAMCKHPAERMELETCCSQLAAPVRVPLCLGTSCMISCLPFLSLLIPITWPMAFSARVLAPMMVVCKNPAERVELETCCSQLSAPVMVPLCLLHGPEKGADVHASRPVPSPGPSFPLSSEQSLMVLGGVRVPVLVSTRTGGALSLSAKHWLQQSRSIVEGLLQLTGIFISLVHPTWHAKQKQTCSLSGRVYIFENVATFALDCSPPLQ